MQGMALVTCSVKQIELELDGTVEILERNNIGTQSAVTGFAGIFVSGLACVGHDLDHSRTDGLKKLPIMTELMELTDRNALNTHSEFQFG